MVSELFIRITLPAMPTGRSYGCESASRPGLFAEYPIL